MTSNTNKQQRAPLSRCRYPNDLRLERRERGLTRKQVASLIGRSLQSVRRYENGRTLPPLLTALKFEILYRTQLGGLYDRLYQELRTQLRTKEAELPASRKRKGAA